MLTQIFLIKLLKKRINTHDPSNLTGCWDFLWSSVKYVRVVLLKGEN